MVSLAVSAYPPPAVITEIGVEPPPQALVEALGAIDIGHRNSHDLELCIDHLRPPRIDGESLTMTGMLALRNIVYGRWTDVVADILV